MAKQKESRLQDRIVEFLEDRGWLCEETHGNVYQKGIPDLFCWHEGMDLFRWVDVKRKERHRYTKDQCRKWVDWEAKSLGVWIMMEATEEWYKKLFEPPNFRDFWKPHYNKYLLNNMDVLREEFPDVGSD